ncbi:MAG: ABC transporter permease [Caldilineales bacterium]|nr:ABC transporter permease [Caldilineales bacterium]
MTTVARPLSTRPTAAAERSESQARVILRRFMRHRLAVVSVILITFIFIISLLAPVLAPFERDAIDLTAPSRPAPPGTVTQDGRVHYMGIDHLGRDLFTRVLYAARVSLSIAILVVLISETFGALLGALAGYYGGIVDTIISRIIEFMLTIPTLPILLIISAILLRRDVVLPLPGFLERLLSALLLAPPREVQKVVVLVLVLVIFGWLGAARLMRGMALSLSKQDFVEALRAVGASDARIIFRHIIPNGLAPILVNASLSLGGVIVLESALSFLGLGVQDPTPTWGNMLSTSQSYMFQHPWLPLVPGVFLVTVSIGFNFIGDGLRDALDPRLKR